MSYSHADSRIGGWLHSALENFRVPARLVGQPGLKGPVPRRLHPIFIDRTELAASGSLSAELQTALVESRFLIVVCTPATPRSKWVDEEIRRFKVLHGEHRVLAVIAGGEPGASAIPGRETEECFPPSLRFRLDDRGGLTPDLTEPLAADLRPQGDGKRLALLKLVATLTGIRLDDLVQREAQRRVRRLTAIAVASLLGMLVTGGLAIYANEQRLQAEQETATANAAVEFLVGIFEIVDSGTENHTTVTAATLLQRSTGNAETMLVGQPRIRARIAETIGRVYNNLGLYRESEMTLDRVRPLLTSLGNDGAPGLLTLAATRLNLGDLDDASEIVANVRASFGRDPPSPTLRARAARISGDIRSAKADQEGAVRDYAEAEAAYQKVPGVKPQLIADIAISRGVILTDMARFREAESALQSGNRIYRQVLGDRHRLTGISYNALAYNEFSNGQYALSRSHIVKAEEILTAVLDANNPTLAGALSLKGQILQQSGDLPGARAALERAIAIYRGRFGGRHYMIGISLVYLALVKADLGRYDEALADFDEARRNYDVGYGRIHANHGDLLVNRATVLVRTGRRDEARADCAAGIIILAKELGPNAGYTRGMVKTCADLRLG